MRKSLLILALTTLSLAGCIQGDGERALVGAGVGAAAALALDENIAAGAAIGAAGGALCDDAGVCQ
jgi:osmotically inducible lipoprotein OsmB